VIDKITGSINMDMQSDRLLTLFCLVPQMKQILLIISLLLLSSTAVGAELDLYTGEVVVANQGEGERKEAIPEALIRVLQKLSGKRDMPITPILDDALLNADSMLLSFAYRNVDRVDPEGNTSQDLRLVARFMQPEVDRVVQQLGLPRWQHERPAVQIWVILDEGRNREIKPVEYEYAWQAMEDVAAMRGLPVIWPELDDEEAQLIDTSLVWGGFTDYLVERGAPGDGVVIVAARREGPRWTLRWSLSAGEQHWNWHSDDQELMFALVSGVHRMADELSAANAILASEQGEWTVDVTVADLRSADDYTACLEYLQTTSLVTAVEVLGAEPGRVYFRLQLNAAPEHLGEVFDHGSVLLSSKTGIDFEYEFLH
jgi:hypothetical protein